MIFIKNIIIRIRPQVVIVQKYHKNIITKNNKTYYALVILLWMTTGI